MDKDNQKKNSIFYTIFVAILGGIIFLVFNNYWYQDHSSYIIKGNRITGSTYVFSFSDPEMGWVPLKKGLDQSQMGILYGLSNRSKEERKLFEDLLQKLNNLDKKLEEK